MTKDREDRPICHLCGERIESKSRAPEEALSREHVPPRQFYPKEMREIQHLNLWVVPAHRRCNESYREDEEYFYHALYLALRNTPMAQTIYRDLRRRVHRAQTPAMIRKILKTCAPVMESGLILPPGIVRFNVDENRARRVAIKIAQGLFYLERQRFLPSENCRDIRLCLDENDVPEMYQLWQGVEAKAVHEDVFSYHYFDCGGLHLWSMLFWQSFVFCTAFDDPSQTNGVSIEQ